VDISNGSPHAIAPHRSGKNGRWFQIGEFGFHNPVFPPNLVGSELTSADFASLEARWIDGQCAESAFLGRVDSFTGSRLVGRKGGDYAGIAIPYFAPVRHFGSRYLSDWYCRHPGVEAVSFAVGCT
jgi:hypothetical protein